MGIGPAKKIATYADIEALAEGVRGEIIHGAYRIIYEIDDRGRLVIVYRIEHRATAYRPR